MNTSLLKTFLLHYTSPNPVCHTCGNDNDENKTQLYACGDNCGIGVYCSVACQKTMWKGVHKFICNGTENNKRQREGGKDGGNYKQKKTTKENDLGLFGQLIMSDYDVGIHLMTLVATLPTYTVSDIMSFVESSYIIERFVVYEWPKFWYLVWKNKSNITTHQTPYTLDINYEKWVYQKWVYNAIKKNTINMTTLAYWVEKRHMPVYIRLTVHGIPTLVHANTNNNIALVRYIVEHSTIPRVRLENIYYFWILDAARENNVNMDLLKYWIEEQHMSPNVLDEFKRSVLMYAAKNDNIDIVKYLVEKGANVNVKNIFQETAFDMATGESKIYLESLLE